MNTQPQNNSQPQQQPQQPQRKPLNTNDESNIYDASVNKISHDNNFRNLQNENRSPVRNEGKSFNQPNNTARSPATSQSNGATRIAKRELWWKEAPPSEAKMVPGGKIKMENVTPRVDHHNPNYKPAREGSKVIETRKLQWNKKALTDTWGNFSHKPQGGNKRYPTEQLEYNALPKVDSGFLYTFAE